MRPLLLAALFSVAAAGGAFAADLPQRMPAKAPVFAPAPVAYNWSGFYFGVNVGGIFGNQDVSLVNNATGGTAASGSVSPDGFIIGDQIGYNWQINQWVLGLEADIQGSSAKEDGAPLTALGSSVTYTSRLRWFGTVRGRIGYAFDRFMPYITGGYAYGDARMDGIANTGGVTRNFENDDTVSGWTLGAGIEWAMLDHWSAKAEYLYVNFGDGPDGLATATTLNIKGTNLTESIARIGLNYRF
jgi:outer membrane immunogenic protein